MDEKNVVKSESLSSYLTCYTNEYEKISPRDHTQVFTNTKSRWLVHYNDDTNHNVNARKLDTFRNYDQPSGSSAPTLKTFQEQLWLEKNRKNEPNEKVLMQKSSEQTRYNQPFDVEKFRRHSSREVSTSILRQNFHMTGWKKDFSIGSQGSFHSNQKQTPVLTNEFYTEISENSTTVETTKCATPKEMLSVRGFSFSRQNLVNQKVGTPLKSNTIGRAEKCEAEKEILRTRHDSALVDISIDEQLGPQESFTLNNEHCSGNIDVQSMRQTLQNSSSPIKKFDLIQSLVLKLSNQKPDERSTLVQEIVDNDLLGVSGENGNTNTIEDLLWPVNITTPHPLQTSAAKLLNDLVSFEVGRDYFSKLSMVKLLTWSGNEQIFDSMADNLIAALKKLSLNRFQRFDMLEKGLLQWLINHMEIVEHSASTVHMESMTDLLRVLMSVENLTEFTSVNVPHLIVVLVRYLTVANEFVQVNVGHVLRTLFSNDSAVAIGNKINLHRIIRNRLEQASNSKLRADLRFIYDLLVKHRTNSSTHPELLDGNVSRSTVSEKRLCFDRQDLNSEIVNQNEQLIHEQNLMQKPEFITESNSSEDEQVENVQLSRKPNQSPADLRTYIIQLCVEKNTGEMDPRTSDEERNDQCATIITNPGADVLFFNSNSRLERSSSLLSSGSQCASSECKETAIQILKMQDIQANAAVEMDIKSQKLVETSSSKLFLKKMYENTPDYSDLSSIAKNRDARNEILENDSFIDELCEKVFEKLRSKLGANFFCGPNCNTTGNANCCSTMKTNVQ